MMTLVRSLLVLVVLAALVVFGGGGWYYSNQVLDPATAGPASRNMVVTGVDGDSISVDAEADAQDYEVDDLTGDLQAGFDSDRGYLRFEGAPLNAEGGAATRSYVVVEGNPPAVGDLGGVETRAFPEDPNVLGLPFSDVTIDTDLGTFAGWEFPGATNPDHWVVFTHGRGGTRGNALRAVQHVVGELGMSALVISYRNDPGAPASPDGHGHFGETEWEDLQAWLSWLERSRVPTEVTLFGLSQGGSVTAFCLELCEGTGLVTGAILDSPLLSLPETLDLQAADRGIPTVLRGPLLDVTGWFTQLRAGLDIDGVEHVQPLADMDLPILAFHGTTDATVPISPTRALASLDPDQVTFVEYEGGHIRGWNIDEDRYDTALTEFLAN